MTDSNSALAELTARVQLLEDERAIHETHHRYCQAVDFGEEAAWVDLFMPDAKLETHESQTGDSTRPLIGHDWIARLVARHTRAPERWHQHQVTNALITLEGDTASCVSYFHLLVENSGQREIGCFGRYYDKMARCPDGRWRFQERIIHIDSTNGDGMMRAKPVG